MALVSAKEMLQKAKAGHYAVGQFNINNLDMAENNAEGWQRKLLNKKASLFIIGHEHFNKSLTLDIENRLMNYMLSVDSVKSVHNSRNSSNYEYKL